MIVDHTSHHRSEHRQRRGRLFLNDLEVGHVSIRAQDGSWGFGDFVPLPEFASFAPIFGRWSLLMHADDEQLSEAAADELRAAEYEIDALRAAMLLEPAHEWRKLLQLNIDGPLIEWKE